VIFYSIGEVMKKTITKEMATKNKRAWFFRRTLPLHPVLAGIVVGMLPGMPASPEVVTIAEKCLYFALAGATCSWVVNSAKHWARDRGLPVGEEEKSPDSAFPSQPPPE